MIEEKILTEENLIDHFSKIGLGEYVSREVRKFKLSCKKALPGTVNLHYTIDRGGFFVLRRFWNYADENDKRNGDITASVCWDEDTKIPTVYGLGNSKGIKKWVTVREEEASIISYLTEKLLPKADCDGWSLMGAAASDGLGYKDNNNLLLGLHDPTLSSSIPQGYVTIHGYGNGASIKISIGDTIKRGRVSFR